MTSRMIALCCSLAALAAPHFAQKGEAPPDAPRPASRPAKGPPSGEFAPTEAEVAEAVRAAAGLLVARQSNYDGEGELKFPPRRLKSEDERKAYEEKRLARAAAFAAESGPPREWAYEGAYRPADGMIPIGYRVGGTALTALALLAIPGFKDDAARVASFERGLAFCLDQLESHPAIQPGFLGGYDTRGWGHTYGLLLCVHTLRLGVAPALKERTTVTARRLVKTLEADEIVEAGGWNYARQNGGGAAAPASTFMTGATLQALFEAAALGIPARRDVIERALATLEAARTDDGAIKYGSTPKRRAPGFDDVVGACGRTALCEATLVLAGRGDVAKVRAGVEAFFAGWDELEARRAKPGTHGGKYQIAPYYFHFAHVYVAQAIELLPEGERPAARARLREVYWRTREPDGTWNDRVFPRSAAYGTATATLGLLMPHLPPPARRG